MAGGPTGSGTDTGPAKGKVTMVSHHNPTALAMTGCTLGPRFVMQGDMSNVDVAHVKKHCKSGRLGNQINDARRAEIWPNQYLDPLLADGQEEGIKFEKLTLESYRQRS